MEVAGEKGRVCVTGAGGYLASWLVKHLLSTGYKVHGTVRDLSFEKNSYLRKFEKASENLLLFKADLLNYDTLKAAIAGCEGVFHVASPVPATKTLNPELELIAPAVNGTLNVMQACSEMKIKRVVVVSSIAAVELNPHWPHDKLKDEECWSNEEFCRQIENAPPLALSRCLGQEMLQDTLIETLRRWQDYLVLPLGTKSCSASYKTH